MKNIRHISYIQMLPASYTESDNKENMIKLFISYTHKDETLIDEFRSHLSPLKSNGTIEDWYDRKIIAGDKLQDDIDNNLEDADIICLMISSDFLASKACMKEKEDALKLKEQKGIRVLPIILRDCDWVSITEISELLCIPTDGKPIVNFENRDKGWLDTINWIKSTCKSINLIENLKISQDFDNFLNSPELLAKSHGSRENLKLEDIFVYPDLKSYNNEETSDSYPSQRFENEILKFGKTIIAGENQAGKSTLCKILFQILRNLKYVPIYLNDENQYLGNPRNKLKKEFQNQYQSVDFDQIDNERIIPIVDDFHYAKHQSKYIENYKAFNHQIIIVDDIFGLNISNQALIKEYKKFKIKEFNVLKRDELIRKWIELNEADEIKINGNHLLQRVDERTEQIESYLGIIFGKGIMPSYPFFILSILATEESFKTLDSKITSQGYCYQALIFLYLRQEGVKSDEINIYSNFLTELAHWIFKEDKTLGLDKAEFEDFLKYYKENYNLPISVQKILLTLSNVNICKYNSLNQYNFSYNYLYYFFVAKYLADNIISEENKIAKIIDNLHKDENAYIAIFIAHHSNSDYVLDELVLDADIMFEDYKPETLSSDSLSFFDKHEDKIIKAVLPSFDDSPREERRKILEEKSKDEEQKSNVENELKDLNERENEFMNDLRKSIKTVEVMGIILKNRSGSLKLDRLKQIYESGLKVHLRILRSFIQMIKEEGIEEHLVNFLIERLKNILKEETDKGRPLKIEKVEELARLLYWNMNFGVLHGFITKAIHSLGSSKLLKISQSVSDNNSSPAYFIVNEGIRMWYSKNLRVKVIGNRIKEKDFSKTAERILKYKIVEHCRLNKMDYNTLNNIERELKMSSVKLLAESKKNN